MTVTWNPSDIAPGITLSNGNRTADSAASAWRCVRATLSQNSGKWYVEYLIVAVDGSSHVTEVGLATSGGNLSNEPGALGATASFGVDDRAGVQASLEGSFALTGNWFNVGYATNDVIQIAVDIGAGQLWVGKNNSYTGYQTSGNPGTGTNPGITFTAGTTLFPLGGLEGAAGNDAIATIQADSANQTYSPPSGFTAWGGAVITVTFRRSLSALGTRTGTRQVQG